MDKLGMERVVLVGHSMGGMVALRMLARDPAAARGDGRVGVPALVATSANPALHRGLPGARALAAAARPLLMRSAALTTYLPGPTLPALDLAFLLARVTFGRRRRPGRSPSPAVSLRRCRSASRPGRWPRSCGSTRSRSGDEAARRPRWWSASAICRRRSAHARDLAAGIAGRRLIVAARLRAHGDALAAGGTRCRARRPGRRGGGRSERWAVVAARRCGVGGDASGARGFAGGLVTDLAGVRAGSLDRCGADDRVQCGVAARRRRSPPARSGAGRRARGSGPCSTHRGPWIGSTRWCWRAGRRLGSACATGVSAVRGSEASASRRRPGRSDRGGPGVVRPHGRRSRCLPGSGRRVRGVCCRGRRRGWPGGRGLVGAGTGATVGKWRGPGRGAPGGLGPASARYGDVVVASAGSGQRGRGATGRRRDEGGGAVADPVPARGRRRASGAIVRGRS